MSIHLENPDVLKKLTLVNCKLDSVNIEDYCNIKHLIVSRNDLKKLILPPGLDIEHLEIDHTIFHKDHIELSGLNKLTTLIITNNRNLNALSNMNCKQLETICAENNQIQAIRLVELTNLYKLDLSRNNLSSTEYIQIF